MPHGGPHDPPARLRSRKPAEELFRTNGRWERAVARDPGLDSTEVALLDFLVRDKKWLPPYVKAGEVHKGARGSATNYATVKLAAPRENIGETRMLDWADFPVNREHYQNYPVSHRVHEPGFVLGHELGHSLASTAVPGDVMSGIRARADSLGVSDKIDSFMNRFLTSRNSTDENGGQIVADLIGLSMLDMMRGRDRLKQPTTKEEMGTYNAGAMYRYPQEARMDTLLSLLAPAVEAKIAGAAERQKDPYNPYSSEFKNLGSEYTKDYRSGEEIFRDASRMIAIDRTPLPRTKEDLSTLINNLIERSDAAN